MELERYEEIWFESYLPELFDDEGYHVLLGRKDLVAPAEGVSLGKVGFVSFFGALLFALVRMI